MLKLIVGVKGTGKTKTLIEMVNTALDTSNGSVVCLEVGDKLRFDIKYQARLIDTSEYSINDAQALYGFVAGIYASNHDITHVYIDSALKMCKNDLESFTSFAQETAALAEKMNIEVVMTVSLAAELLPEELVKYE